MIIISLTVLFSLLGISGGRTLYAPVEFDAKKAPFLSRVFVGINEGIYPWQIFGDQNKAAGTTDMADAEDAILPEVSPITEGDDLLPSVEPIYTPTPMPTPTPTATPEPTPEFPEGRLEPLRESTKEEYQNHVSADIYGDIGERRAAKYEFKEVPIEYFDDALFIGDSRTVGLGKYTDLSEHADFMCETSLTVKKAFTSNFKGKGKLETCLKNNNYAKIYVMVGINELGTGTTEYFMEDYTAFIDRIRELSPDSIIFIQAIMNVDKEKNDTDKIFNNANIMGRNHAIATLADNETIFYINVNEVVCDPDGNLDPELTFDHIHLIGSADEIWKEFLMKHGV